MRRLFCLITMLYSLPVGAFSLGAGLAGVEEGDDRLRPAAVIHAGWNDAYLTNFALYGRTFRCVTERTVLASLARRAAVPGFSALKASIGLFLLDEETTFNANDPITGVPMGTERGISGGVTFGIEGHLLQVGAISVRAAWESYLVPAGADGAIFLATGRKQLFSLVMGGGL